MRLWHRASPPGAPAIGSANPTTGHALPRPPRPGPPGSAINRAPPRPQAAPSLVDNQTDGRVMTTCEPKRRRESFFYLAQAHVGGSAPIASVPTTTSSPPAMARNCGMDHPAQSKGANMESWLTQTALPSVSTGNSLEAARTPATLNATSAQAVGSLGMVPRLALEQRRREATFPYIHSAWASEFTRLSLWAKYPSVVEGFKSGFHLGITAINRTFTPPNHLSILLLPDIYNATIHHEFAVGRYVGPFTRAQLEPELGPFQTSPLSFVPKTSKPGTFRAVHNFSYPHNPSPQSSLVNLHIDSEHFPCTWGTFTTVALLIARLPPGAQASVRDVVEAYRMIPASPSQWPGLIIRLQARDQFAVNVCNNIGLSSAGGMYGMVADAVANVFRSNGIGPLSKWVDDHIFFRIPRERLPAYNLDRARWGHEIQLHGGQQHEGSRLWYKGKDLPNGQLEEFDEDCRVPLQDWVQSPPGNPNDEFSYSDTEIDAVSERLGIHWEPSKAVPFGFEIPYLGLLWDLRARTVCLLEKKRVRYLDAILKWEESRTHNLLEMQQLYGKLLHASLVVPLGRAYLTNMETMLGSFHDHPFLPRTPPKDTQGDLGWWKRQLGQPDLPRPIPTPQPIIDFEAYSDASSSVRIAITIGTRWRAWCLAPGWKSQGRDIQWAEAVGFELLVLHILTISSEGQHVKVYGDNRGVVEGWWKRSSRNQATNHVFRRVLKLLEEHDRVIHLRYIPSAENPADAPSRGLYPSRKFLLEDFDIPSKLSPFLIGVGPAPPSQSGSVKASEGDFQPHPRTAPCLAKRLEAAQTARGQATGTSHPVADTPTTASNCPIPTKPDSRRFPPTSSLSRQGSPQALDSLPKPEDHP